MKTKIIVPITALVTLMFTDAQAEFSKNKLRSGIYGESLRIAVNSQDKTVTGYFSSAGGYLSGEGWNCNFYFSGKIKNNGGADIVASSVRLKSDEARTTSKGTIVPYSNGKDGVIIKLDDEVSGCARGEDFSEQEPSPRMLNDRDDSFEPQELRKRGDDFEFRVVKVKRSYFYPSSVGKEKNKAYLVCGDIVLVTEKTAASNRVKAEYRGKKKSTKGWLSQNDLLGISEELKCE